MLDKIQLSRSSKSRGLHPNLVFLWLLALSYPFHIYVDVSSLRVNLSYGDAVVAAVVIAWALGLVGSRKLPQYTAAIAGFAAVAAISIAVNVAVPFSDYLNPAHSVGELVKFGGAVVWMVAVYALARDFSKDQLLSFCLVIAAPAALFSIRAALTFEVGDPRPRWPFENPNIFANYLGMATFMLLLVANVWWEKYRQIALIAIVLATISVGGIFVTGSRGGMLGMFPALALALVWHPTTRRLGRENTAAAATGAIGIAGAAAIALYAASLTETGAWIIQRVTVLDPSSRNVWIRLEMWENAVIAVQSSPVIGIGYGALPSFNVARGTAELDIHNTYLSVLAETGVVGFAIAGVVMAWILSDGFAVAREHPEATFLVAFLVGTMAQGLVTDVDTFRSLWIVVGLLAAYSHRTIPSREPYAPEELAARLQRRIGRYASGDPSGR
ncbi:O-antigen ligase family protein [Haloferacaceae archaeon DSL9]